MLIQTALCQFPDKLSTPIGLLMCSNLLSIMLISCYLKSLLRILGVRKSEEIYDTLSQDMGDLTMRLHEKRSHVHYDGLTKARSRLFLLQEVTRLLDSGTPFSLVYIDLDGLKHIYDTKGHQAGDEYLKQFVVCMYEQLRGRDVVARYGGDEFVVLMPGCPRDTAVQRMEQIEAVLVQENNISFSAGVTDTAQGTTLDGLLALADQQMYQRKREKKKQREEGNYVCT